MKCFRALIILCLVSAICLRTSHCRFVVKDASLISTVCNKSPNPRICLYLLTVDPRSNTADMLGLTKILVDQIKVTADDMVEAIKASYGSQPELKASLDACSKNYEAILNDVSSVLQALARQNLKVAEDKVADAINQAVMCGKGVEGVPKLAAFTGDMEMTCEIAKAIVGQLIHN